MSLNLSDNRLKKFPEYSLMNLPVLSNMDLSFNKIKVFNLKHVIEYPVLRMLNVTGNLFYEIQGVRHIISDNLLQSEAQFEIAKSIPSFQWSEDIESDIEIEMG